MDLKKMAKELGADAVVSVKYSNVGVEYDRENNSNRSYFVIYGTAVKFIN